MLILPEWTLLIKQLNLQQVPKQLLFILHQFSINTECTWIFPSSHSLSYKLLCENKMKQIWCTSLLLMTVMTSMAIMVFAEDSDVSFDIPCFLECTAGCSAHQNIKCITSCFERCIIAPKPPAASPVPQLNPCKLACSNVECTNINNG